jgi:RND family efflux transporter MFP subunit
MIRPRRVKPTLAVKGDHGSMHLSSRGLIAGGLLVGLVATACGSPQQPATPIATPTPKAIVVGAESVRRGDIQQTLNYSGDIRAREQISVMPRASGRVEQMLVDVGSRVTAGDTLAILDHDTAEIAVFTARANLAGAESRLANLRSGGRADDTAVAQASLVQQQIRLENMRSGGRAEDVKLAQAALDAQQAKLDQMLKGGRPEAIRQAQSGIDAAQAKLTALQKGATNELRQTAQSAVDADTASVASAEAAYAALGGANAADLQAAQGEVESLRASVQAAKSSIASADAALNNLKGTAPADIQQAQSAYDQAVAQLRSAAAALEQAKHPTQSAIADAEASLEQARSQRQQAQAQQSALDKNVSGACADVPGMPRNGTACGDAKTAASAGVSAGNAAVEAAQGQLDLLKRGGSPAQQAQLQAAVDQGQAQVKANGLRLDALRNGGVEAQRAQLQTQRDQASSQLTGAEQSLKTSEARLASINNGSRDAQIKASAAQVTAARERLKADHAHLVQLLEGPTEEDVQQAEAQLEQARQGLALAAQPSTEQDIRAQRAAVLQARLELDKAHAPFTDFDQQQQEQAVAQAEAALHKAQNPYTDDDLQAAQSSVDQAHAQLDLAVLGLKDTRILAPVDGRVSERPIAPGGTVNPQTAIVTLVPPSLEVVVNVDESQLAQIAEGQSVQLQVAAYPNQTFDGTVKAIAPTLEASSRTAAIHIAPIDDQSRLRAGMFARLSVVTATKRATLLVPREAILKGDGVMSVDGGSVRRTPVKVGLQDERFAEILSGVDEGDVVATSGLADLKDGDVVSPQVPVVANQGAPRAAY